MAAISIVWAGGNQEPATAGVGGDLPLQTVPTPVSLVTSVADLQDSDALDIAGASVHYIPANGSLHFEIRVSGQAGSVGHKARGQLDGAPVVAYVFPTSLSPRSVGFGQVEGILALAVTSHPDFDDTPLWDENLNGDPTDAGDGLVYHTHWVVLQEDSRVPGGLSVAEFESGTPERRDAPRPAGTVRRGPDT